MRLKDEDALKELIADKLDERFRWDSKLTVCEFKTIIGDIIDNAPTVFSCNACKNMGNERECVDCHDYSNYVHYDERPQGEWKEKRDEKGGWIECDKCGHEPLRDFSLNVVLSKYCPNCGADIRSKL